MKKFVSIAIAAVCLLAGAVSCTKTSTVVASYGFDQDEIGELRSTSAEAASAFVNDLGGVITRFSGTEFTEFEIVSACDEVVAKHNHKSIEGTFSLYRLDINTHEKIGTAKTWTMVLADN